MVPDPEHTWPCGCRGPKGSTDLTFTCKACLDAAEREKAIELDKAWLRRYVASTPLPVNRN